LCLATVNTFVSILGAECSNMALKVMSTGGVYLGGGIPARIIPQIESGRFMEVFVRKGRLKDLLSRMPIYVITQQAALIGAATCGLDLLQEAPA
jgi:glucokinase